MIEYKSNSKFYNDNIKELTEVLLNYRSFGRKHQIKLERLGFHCKVNKHIMLFYDGKFVVSLSKTPSDNNSGRASLRQIRNFCQTNGY